MGDLAPVRVCDGQFTAMVPAHGVVLVKLTAAARLAAARPKPTSGDLMAKMSQTWETTWPLEAVMAGRTDKERP
jgi:hypothetical protein